MDRLALLPAGITLGLALAGLLLLGVGIAARHLPWFRREPAVLRADRLLLGILGPLIIAGAVTACVIVTLLDHLLEFHRLPHLCLDPTMATSLGKLALFAIEGAAVLASAVVARQVWGAARLFREYHRLASAADPGLSPKTVAAAARVRECLGASFFGIREADIPMPNAFAVGILSPGCVLARSLVSRLSSGELAAVVAHEVSHLRRRDPAVRFVVFFCARMFGFLPPVRSLLRAWEEAAEMAADDLAVEATGCRLELAAALLAAADPVARLAPALVAGPGHLVARRVERLLSPPRPAAGIPWRRGVSLLVAAGIILAVVAAALYSPLLPSLHCLVENVALHKGACMP